MIQSQTLLYIMAVLAVVLTGPSGNAQTAQELLDKALEIRTPQTSFAGTCSSRRISMKLIRQEDRKIGESHYIITDQEYQHLDVRMRSPNDWIIDVDETHFIPNSDFSRSTFTHSTRIKLKDKTLVGSTDDQNPDPILRNASLEDFNESLRRILVGSTDARNAGNNLVYSRLLPAPPRPGNRSQGLRTPVIKRVETSFDGTKVYCIGAKSPEGETVLLWINGSDFRIMRTIHLGNKMYYSQPMEAGSTKTWFDYKEFVYTYSPAIFSSEDEFTASKIPFVDLSLESNRTRFQDIMDVVNLCSDQFALSNLAEPSKLVRPNPNKVWSSELRRGILSIETDKGMASGFITTIKGLDFAITNLHVINSDKKIILKTMTGTEIPYTALYGAVGRDIALFRIAKTSGGLRIADNIETSIQTGQSIVALGYDEALGGTYEKIGLLLGIGPDRIETYGNIYPGSYDECPQACGSPIISDKTGEVIGVASYMQSGWVDLTKLTLSSDPIRRSDLDSRWFGFRIDEKIQWQLIDLPAWQTQRKRIDRFRLLSDMFISVIRKQDQDLTDQPRLLAIVNAFKTKAGSLGKDSPLYAEEVKRYSRSLRILAEEDMQPMASTDFYDYYRSCLYWDQNVLDQLAYRAAIIAALKNFEANPLSLAARLRGN